ncbi:MAG: hypothetical protein K0Q49_1164 [Haloplasmataceae bacterium]|jgi:uncharacterized RDD family membrane protein YckC|nr:hypothetical protein [Haloplasmataceae bacterium]
MEEYFNQKRTTIYLSETTASLKSRIKAHLLDRMICLICLSPFLIWIFTKVDRGPYIFAFSLILILISTMLYIIVPTITKGRTLGKMIVGLRTISVGDEHANSGQHIGRGLIYVLVPIFEIVYGYYLNIVMILFWFISLYYFSRNRYNQSIHDKYSYCYVVVDRKYQEYLKQL